MGNEWLVLPRTARVAVPLATQMAPAAAPAALHRAPLLLPRRAAPAARATLAVRAQQDTAASASASDPVPEFKPPQGFKPPEPKKFEVKEGQQGSVFGASLAIPFRLGTGVFVLGDMDDFWRSFPDGSDTFGMQQDFPVEHTGRSNEEGSPIIGSDASPGCPPPSSQQGHPSSLPRMPGTKKVGTGKKPNFTIQEDLALVSCWLNVSTDPIVSNGQRKEALWMTISRAYNRNRGQFSERSQKSLNNRWEFIKEQVSKYAGYLQQVVNDNRSDHTDADKTAEAVALFNGLEKRPFTVMHCWDILKNEAKWVDLQDKRNNIDSDEWAEPPPYGQASNSIDLDADTCSPTSQARKRPIGRDAAKEAKKQAGSTSGSASSSEYVSRLHDMHLVKMDFWKSDAEARESRLGRLSSIEEQKVQNQAAHHRAVIEIDTRRAAADERRAVADETRARIEETRSRIEAERLEWEKQREIAKDEERILAINLDNCTPAQRVYYQMK